MKRVDTLIWLTLSLTSLGCGADEEHRQSIVLTPAFRVLPEQELSCAELQDLIPTTQLLVTVFDQVTGQLLDDRVFSCESDIVLPAPTQDVIIDVTARNGEDSLSLVLFNGRISWRLGPSSDGGRMISITLDPQAAFVNVSWGFSGGFSSDASRCPPEVANVETAVSEPSDEANRVSFLRPCTDAPFILPTALAPGEYMFSAVAYSANDDEVFLEEVQVLLLEPGLNDYTGVLTATGTQLLFDWGFQVERQFISQCDDPNIDVRRLTVTLETLRTDSEEPDDKSLSQRVDCAVPRPVVFEGTRLDTSREYRLRMNAEGQHVFNTSQRLVFEANELVNATEVFLTLDAVGTATVSVEVESIDCEPESVEGFGVEVYSVTPDVFSLEQVFGLDERIELENLPYDEYELGVTRLPELALCPRQTLSVDVTSRLATWPRVVF